MCRGQQFRLVRDKGWRAGKEVSEDKVKALCVVSKMGRRLDGETSRR